MMERAHALLSASSAKRWLNCTPSARLEDPFPETASPYAEEGTLAHEICELKLRKLFTEPAMSEKAFKIRLNKLKKSSMYQDEMDRFTDDYTDYIQQIVFGYPTAPYVAVEKKLDYGHAAPEGFGTADCIVISGTDCHIIDFKYGKGVPVDALENPQLSLYALGAMAEYGMFYAIEKITLHIVQPRLKNFSAWETSAEDLNHWMEDAVKPKAALAFSGEGTFQQGEWCRFCRAYGSCRNCAEENLSLEAFIDPISGKLSLPPLLDNAEVGTILKRAQNLAAWVKKLESHALAELVKGETIPGWKIVEGRSNRVIKDVDTAYEALKNAGYKKALLYDQKPITLTEVERLISKEDYNTILAPFIEKPKGKPTLAEAADKRPAYEARNAAEADFGGSNQYNPDKN